MSVDSERNSLGDVARKPCSYVVHHALLAGMVALRTCYRVQTLFLMFNALRPQSS